MQPPNSDPPPTPQNLLSRFSVHFPEEERFTKFCGFGAFFPVLNKRKAEEKATLSNIGEGGGGEGPKLAMFGVLSEYNFACGSLMRFHPRA